MLIDLQFRQSRGVLLHGGLIPSQPPAQAIFRGDDSARQKHPGPFSEMVIVSQQSFRVTAVLDLQHR